MADSGELKKIQFKIHKCSSYSSNSVPENVLVDRPRDQSSRWSTSTNTPPQFLTVRLCRPAVVKTITFGKFDKAHVCNLKKFTVVGGMQDGNFVELLSGGLENNGVQETFHLRHTTRDGSLFPVQYISVIPHEAWGPSFNYCIWYLEFHGVDNPGTVKSVLYKHNLQAEIDMVRVCLKHFRQQRYLRAFSQLQRDTGVQLEAPALSRLYALLVEGGDFEGAEATLQEARIDGLFNWYASQQPYSASWSVVSPCSPELAQRLRAASGDSPPVSPPESPPPAPPPRPLRPGQRGGHQMCVDSEANTLYLFGGWDGEQDLSDLWSYHVCEDKWTLICKESELVGGPCPRSCHKMVLDSGRRQIFVLGRYLDVKYRSIGTLPSDLYMFDIGESRWCLVSEDTAACGGPQLMFDHQMCIDSERHIIYVFGGKILPPVGFEDSPAKFSGLYSYHIAEDRWQLMLSDNDSVPYAPRENTILSRVSHSMLFHPSTRTLYVFGGLRNKEHLADLLAVHVGSGSACVRSLCVAAPPRRAPPPGFTQRATIDPQLLEIYVLSSLSKEKDRRVSNSMWVFSLTRMQWSCVYKNDNEGQQYWAKMQTVEPCPRFAHQLVYDPLSKVHFLFGGNPGRSANSSLRLDDFWALKLSRLSSDAAWRQARLKVRKLKFEELVGAGRSTEALQYLQENLHQAIDHSDQVQARQFQLMATMLFSERQPAMTFHPPLEPETMAQIRDPPRSDPELHEDERDTYSSQVPLEAYPDAEQQAMFAAVLGMEYPDVSDIFEPSSSLLQSESDSSNSTKTTNMSDDSYWNNMDDGTIRKDKWNELETHHRRCELFQQLSEYFPHHMVQPKKNLTDYISM